MKNSITKYCRNYFKALALVFLIQSGLSYYTLSFGNPSHCNIPKRVNDTTSIAIGNRTGDTTGVITISNSGIQQSIISDIPSFTNWTVTSEQARLSVNPNKCYLTFKIRKPTGDTAAVAIEVRQITSNLLMFVPYHDTEVFYYTSYGSCNDCKFQKDWDKNITGCTCKALSTTIPAPSGCKYSVIRLQ